MTSKYATINKNTLEYILKGKNVREEYVAKKTKISVKKLKQWQNCSNMSLPTIKQAKALADCLHVPFVSLYMNKEDIPLKKIPKIKDLRTIMDANIDDSALNIAVLDVLLERDFLLKANEEFKIECKYFAPSIPESGDPVVWADAIRNQFSIDIGAQPKFLSSRKLYLYLREQVENAGVFVQCFTSVLVECARGFAIYDTILPIIGINDDDRSPAKSFTLIHELVHLLKRDSSYCNDMTTTFATAKEEAFCNAVAGELLVPKHILELILERDYCNTSLSANDIKNIAKNFSVSREVIIRRLLDLNIINRDEYSTYNDIFRKEFEQKREEQRIAGQDGGKVNFYLDVCRRAIDRTSPAISKILCYAYNEEFYSKHDIARHLGISYKHIDKFLMEVSRWNK